MKSRAWDLEVIPFHTDTFKRNSSYKRRSLPLLGLAAAVLAVLAVTGCVAYTGTNSSSSSGGTLAVSAAAVDFGDVTLGSKSTQPVSFTNAGSTSVDISQISISGTGFSLAGSTPSSTLRAGQSTVLNVTFAPTVAGDATGAFSITSNAKNSPTKVGLKGKGAKASSAAITATPSTISFGNIAVGSTAQQSVTITNSATMTENITGVSASGSGFSVSGISFPYSLAAGSTTTFQAHFAPTAASTSTGNIAISASAGSSGANASVALSGTGAQAKINASPTSVSFGAVASGSSGSQPISISNPGNASLTISQFTVSGSGFSTSGLATPLTIQPGQSASFNAVFKPASSGNSSGSISLASNAPASPLVIALSGSQGQAGISASPASVSFGSVTTGNTNSQPISISNPGNASLTISQATVTGSGFSTSGLTTPVTIQPGQSASFNAVFKPSSSGSVSGSISLASNAPNTPLVIALSGSGSTASYSLSVSPSSVSFGSVTVGSSSSQNVSLQNTGNSSITISSVGVTGAGFSNSGVNAGLLLAPSQSATMTVSFSPTTSGSATGGVSIASNATNSPQTVSLSGTGAASHSVILNWASSSSSGVVGYNVYRGTASGAYSKINASLVSSTAYTDTTVQSGQNLTYYYVVTSVNSSGTESTNSNQATALVP